MTLEVVTTITDTTIITAPNNGSPRLTDRPYFATVAQVNDTTTRSVTTPTFRL
jgi:hypothetical protein